MFKSQNAQNRSKRLHLATLLILILTGSCAPNRRVDMKPRISVAAGVGKSRMTYQWYSDYGKPRPNTGLFANGGAAFAIRPRLYAGVEASYWTAMDLIDSPDLKTAFLAANLTANLPAKTYVKIAAGPARHWGDHGNLSARSLLASAEAGIDFGRDAEMRYELFAGYQHFLLGHQPNPSSSGALPPSHAFSGSLLQVGLRLRAK